MVKKITLNSETRSETNGSARAIRREGSVPAVLYGPKMEPIALKIKLNELEKAFHSAGESSLINLSVDGKEDYKVIIKDIQRHGIKNTLSHADFYKVDMKKAIEVEIPLHFIGEAKAEKELGGTLVKNAETINVKCLPGALVEFVEVDISVLKTFDDMVHFRDIKLSDDMELLNNPDDALVHVMESGGETVEETAVAEKPAEAAAAESGAKK